MKTFINKLIDIFSALLSRISFLATLLVLSLIILSRINNLFGMELFNNNKFFVEDEVETVEVTDNKSKITYQGGKPSPEEIQAEEEQNNAKLNMISFEISSKQTPESVATLLMEKQLITDPATLILMLQEANLISKIQPGPYEVPADITNADLIAKITNTKPLGGNAEKPINLITFEILEGQTPEEVANTLKEVGLIKDPASFILLLENNNLLEEIKSGKYKVPDNIKNLELIELITIAGQ